MNSSLGIGFDAEVPDERAVVVAGTREDGVLVGRPLDRTDRRSVLTELAYRERLFLQKVRDMLRTNQMQF